MKPGPKPANRPKTRPAERAVTEVPEPPAMMTDPVALEAWERLWTAGIAGKRLFDSSYPLAVGCCLTFARLMRSEIAMGDSPEYVERRGRGGELTGLVPNPHWQAIRESRSDLIAYARSLAMRPGDLVGAEVEDEKPKFSVETFIAKIPGRTTA